MTKVRVRLALGAGVLAAAAGCAQVFGLGDYGQQPEDAGAGGSDATMNMETAPPGDAGNGGDARPSNPDGGNHPDAPAADGPGVDAGFDAPIFAPDACTGANVCVPSAPMNWAGPLALWEGTTNAPSCPTYYLHNPEFEGGLSPSAAAAQCSCSCDTPSGSTCSGVQMQLATGGCSSTTGCSAVSLPQGSCLSVQSAVTGCGTGAGFTIDGSVATGGGCQPDGSVILPDPTWVTQAIACAPNGQTPAGCPSGQTCVPGAGTPFLSHYCVMQAGMNNCPTGFPTQHLYNGGVSDTRGCSPCTCGSPSGVDCNSGAQVRTWGNQSCNANPGPTLSPLPQSACTSASAIHSVEFTTSPTGGSCAPDGGQPIGSVTAQGVTTICCTL